MFSLYKIKLLNIIKKKINGVLRHRIISESYSHILIFLSIYKTKIYYLYSKE